MSELQRALLRELVIADEGLSADLAALESLAAGTAAVREHADALLDLFGSAERERQRLGSELTEAEAEAAERAQTLAEAERELAVEERKGDEERLAAARRFLVRARDASSVATKRVEASRANADAFEELLSAAALEVPEVETAAAEIARSLQGRPRVAEEASTVPVAGLPGVVEWATVARAALFVARTAVAAEREALIRQANELGSVILGRSLYAASPAMVAASVSRA